MKLSKGKNMLQNEAMEVFDGTMLGDSSLKHSGGSAFIDTTRSGEQYMSYLTQLRDTLILLGMEFCTDHPKSSEQVSKGKPYTYCCLSSHTSSFLLEQRHRWYPGGKKIVPNDVRITPLSMAYEFMDDGSTSWLQGNNVTLSLSTNSFTREEVYRLRDSIAAKFGVYFYPLNNHGWMLFLRKTDEVNLFLDQIEEYILPCYEYKVKRPWYKGTQDGHESEESIRDIDEAEESMQKEISNLRRKLGGNS